MLWQMNLKVLYLVQPFINQCGFLQSQGPFSVPTFKAKVKLLTTSCSSQRCTVYTSQCIDHSSLVNITHLRLPSEEAHAPKHPSSSCSALQQHRLGMPSQGAAPQNHSGGLGGQLLTTSQHCSSSKKDKLGCMNRRSDHPCLYSTLFRTTSTWSTLGASNTGKTLINWNELSRGSPGWLSICPVSRGGGSWVCSALKRDSSGTSDSSVKVHIRRSLKLCTLVHGGKMTDKSMSWNKRVSDRRKLFIMRPVRWWSRCPERLCSLLVLGGFHKPTLSNLVWSKNCFELEAELENSTLIILRFRRIQSLRNCLFYFKSPNIFTLSVAPGSSPDIINYLAKGIWMVVKKSNYRITLEVATGKLKAFLSSASEEHIWCHCSWRWVEKLEMFPCRFWPHPVIRKLWQNPRSSDLLAVQIYLRRLQWSQNWKWNPV